MSSLISAAANGLRAQQARLNVVTNNLANANTTGYKAVRPEQQDDSYELRTIRLGGEAVQATTEAWLGNGVVVSTRQLHTQGELVYSESSTDLAIMGEGYFQVRRNDGEIAYTRDGRFQFDVEGRLLNGAGQRVVPEVNLPLGGRNIDVRPTGEIIAEVEGAQVELGRIELARFANPSGLRSVGGNQFLATEQSGAPRLGNPGEDGAGEIASNNLEQSTVDPGMEAVRMMEAQRAYQLSLRALKAVDEMIAGAISIPNK
jgi:flagellar basal-body rod protein FlgG